MKPQGLHRSAIRRALVLVACVGFTAPSFAERSEVEPADRIIVVGHRDHANWLETPASVSVVDSEEIQRARRQLTLGESLGLLPGVFVQNRGNFAQDARISIRGFGARTPFGIRGLELIVDGIPQTLPDGQGQVDSLDLSMAARIEVLRGPGASLYGSAAGGVIDVTSFSGTEEPEARARVALGFHGYRNYQATGRGQQDNVRYALGLSRTEIDGHRDHSRAENILFNVKFEIDLDASSDLMLVVSHADAPQADDPGGLTADEVASDRGQANARNVDMKSGEALEHTTLGARYRYRFNANHETTATGFLTWRDFDGRVPSTSRGAIELDRFFGGGSLKHTVRESLFERPNRLVVGVDVDGQGDDRKQRAIDPSTGSIGDLDVDELQRVTSVGVFVLDEYVIAQDITISASARYDRVRFEIDDDFTSDPGGDDSDTFSYSEWSFAGGAAWTAAPQVNPFVRVATSFETPTASGLANPNADAGGFNEDLEAQTAVHYELGSKGRLAERLRYEAAIFYITIDNELLPFTRDFSTFYENADRSERLGLELALSVQLTSSWMASASYTHSRFVFDKFRDGNGNDFDGNRLPGVPRNVASLAFDYQSPQGAFARFEVQYVDEREADNANTAEADDYVVANLLAGFNHAIDRWDFEAFFGIDNLTDQKYDDNLRINASFGRYFEPAPRRTFHVGVGTTLHF